MSLPPFLAAEIRLVFRSCARSGCSNRSRYFSAGRVSCSKSMPPTDRQSRENRKRTSSLPNHSPHQAEKTPPARIRDAPKALEAAQTGNELVPREEKGSALDTDRRIHVPLKVIPRAELSPNVKLSPTQRLHIEMLTRRVPRNPERKIYKETLLIYHLGKGREFALVFSKCASITIALFAITAIVVPAHYFAGTSLWIVGAIFIGGWVPVVLLHTLTKTWVSRVFLHLPPHARQSPKAAMDYANNLPASAKLDLEFYPLVPLARKISAHLSDLAPSVSRWPPSTLKWIGPRADSGSFWFPNPTRFFVNAKSSSGKAARFTIPGIWNSVYNRLVGIESPAATRWKR